MSNLPTQTTWSQTNSCISRVRMKLKIIYPYLKVQGWQASKRVKKSDIDRPLRLLWPIISVIQTYMIHSSRSSSSSSSSSSTSTWSTVMSLQIDSYNSSKGIDQLSLRISIRDVFKSTWFSFIRFCSLYTTYVIVKTEY